MEINHNHPINSATTTSQVKAAAQSWQVGQLLKGTVIETLQNSVKLRIDNTLVQAPTNKQHPLGETLMMTVMRAGAKPLLRVATPQATAQPAQLLQNSALKVLLPKQVPLPALLANLTSISQAKTELAVPLPAEFTQNVKKLLSNIITSDQAGDPKAMQRAILNSGTLLEKKLVALSSRTSGNTTSPLPGNTTSPLPANTTPSSIAQDLKGNLLQLLESVQRLPRDNSIQKNIPLPLQTTLKETPPGTLNPLPARAEQQAAPRTVKEALLRLLNTSSAAPHTENSLPAVSAKQSTFNTALQWLPLPFFRHMPLLPQKAQQPSLALFQHRDQMIVELIRQFEGSVARIQLSQLASLPQSDNPQPSWLLELPLRHGESVNVVQMRIEQETSETDDDQEKRWRVTLTLDLPEIGTIYATITTQGESSATTLWAENSDTATLIDNNLGLLHEAIEAHGISVREIRCQHGVPPHPPNQQRHTVLVDTQV